jgi:hypothetical protein
MGPETSWRNLFKYDAENRMDADKRKMFMKTEKNGRGKHCEETSLDCS